MSHIPTGDATTASRPATPPNHLTETRGATQPALADSLEVPPTSVAPSSGGPPLNDSAITATAAASADARETTSATPAVRFAAVEPTAAEAETTRGRDPRVVYSSDEDLHLSLDSQPEEVADLFNRSQRPPVSVATPAHTDTMKFSYAEPSAFPLSAADHRSSPLHEAGESRRTANPSLNTSSRMNHRKNSATMKKFFSTSLPPASPSPPPPPPSTAIPAHLADLAAEIHNLDEHDLLLIADLAHDVATKGVYSLLPYTGANWFLPAIREKTPDEPPWGVNFSWSAGLLLYVAGRRLSIPLLNLLLRLAFLVLVWFTLWAVLPSSLVEPGGVVWDPVVLVVICALVGGLVCRIIQIPPLVGVLWMGIFWNNVPHLHALTASIAPQLFSISSKIGLSVILARAGFSLSLKGIAPHWRQTALLCTLPFVIEGVSNSLIAAALFGYTDDYRWAFLQGMLCSIASPAVVVPSSLYLQELGYGRGVGPLSLMLSSVGLEIVLGVWTVNFIISLIFGSVGTAVLVVLGPVQLVGGVLLGIVLGLAFHYIVELIKGKQSGCQAAAFSESTFYSSLDFSYLIFIAICVALVSAGYKLRVAAGGSVTCVFFSSTVAQLWLRGANPEREEQKRYFGAWLAATWDHAVMPILFAFMGARIDIKSIFSAEFFPKAVVCLVCSTVIRIIVIFMVQLGSIFSWKERFLVCVGYLGKASAQASMGPLALEFVNNQIDALAPLTDPTLNEWLGYATNVEQISAMYVMFMAAVASVGLLRGGLAMLVKDENAVKSVPPSAPPAPSPRQPRSKQQKPSPTKARSAFEDAKGSDSELSTPQAAPVASRSPRRVRVEDGGGAIPHRRRRADLNTESRIDTPPSPLRNTDSPRVVELSSLPRIPQSMQHPRNNGTLTGKRPCGGPAGVSNAKNDLLESYLESSGYYVSSPARNSSSMASTHPALTPTSPLMHSAEVWEQSSWVPERPGSRGEAHPSLSPPDQTAMVEVPSLKVC